jgi:alcohol dehydrogenase YqhD (iron-dependent ADH family)
MENFTFQNPTKIYFGNNVLDKLPIEAEKWGTKTLVIIGKNSVKKNGILASVCSTLNMANISYHIFDGIKSNPIFEDADRAIAIAKKEKVDFILAVGGGSVIDTAKAVAIGYYADHSVWDFYEHGIKAEKALPLLSILTVAATGSEMNQYTVLQNNSTGAKKGYGSTHLYPKASFLNPEYTFTVSPEYTAYGVADLISHSLEIYFGQGKSDLSDHYVASILRLAIKWGPIAVNEPENYEARAQIMWLATNALNGSLSTGKKGGDWGVHAIEHSLSVLYDIPHGGGLSIVFPAWLTHHLENEKQRLAFLGREVFQLTNLNEDEQALGFIKGLKKFFTLINSPVSLSEVKIEPNQERIILENLIKNKVNGAHHKLNESDYSSILEKMW